MHKSRLRAGLVVAQLAMSCLLLIGAGLVVKSFAAMQREIDVPVLLLHGDQDRLINVAAARAAARANPQWQFEVAEGVGHVPQLEDPQWTVEKILGWLAAHPEVADVAAQARPTVRYRGGRSPWRNSRSTCVTRAMPKLKMLSVRRRRGWSRKATVSPWTPVQLLTL